MGQPPLFEIVGLGWPVVWASVVLTVLGVSFAVRGFWGGDRRSRRLALVAAILTLVVAFVASAFLLLHGFQLVARLGPAATAKDLGAVWRHALSPAIVGVVSFCLTGLVSGIGWALERSVPDPEQPPRRPAR